MKDNVLIVPAGRLAYDQYKKWETYICQENRSFQDAEYMAFYYESVIQKDIPKIVGIIKSFNMERDNAENAHIKVIGNTDKNVLIERLKSIQKSVKESVESKSWYNGWNNEFIFLSRGKQEGTIVLENKIPNDKTDKNGKNTAFTMKHTYRDLNSFKTAKFTSDLYKVGGNI